LLSAGSLAVTFDRMSKEFKAGGKLVK